MAAANGIIGWGVLGTGLQAQRFARDLVTVAGARLVAVASRDKDRAREAAKAMGAERGAEGMAGLAALADVRIVYIATPTHRHKADCLAALAAGKAVLCEKPLAMTEADAREIAETAERAGLFCMEALWTHFIPAVAETERLLAAGVIGAPRTLIGSFGLATHRLDDPSDMPDGGALLDRGCYLISLALRLFGAVEAIDGRVVKGASGADLTAAVTLSFNGGRTAMLAASMIDQLENRLFIGGDRGAIGLNDVTCPTMITVTAAAPISAPLAAGLKGRLRESRRRAVRRSSVLALLRHLAGSFFAHFAPCKGFGFVHEIEEVHGRLRAGALQSDIHPLSRGIETLRIIEAVGRLDGRQAGG